MTFVIDGSRATQSVVIPAPRAQRPTSGHVHRETPIVPWITIITSLFCAGLVLMGMIAPQFMKWPWFLGAIMISFIAVCIGQFSRQRAHDYLSLARLSYHLAWGLLVVSILGLLSAAVAASDTILRRFTVIAYLWNELKHLFAAIFH